MPSISSFWRLIGTLSFLNFGGQVSLIALPAIAVLMLSATPSDLGILGILTFLPSIFLSILAGVLVDRFSRLGIILTTSVLRFLFLLTIPISYYFHALSLFQLFVLTFVLGTLGIFTDLASQALMPALVGRSGVLWGNSRLQVSQALTGFAGPPICGYLILVFMPPIALIGEVLMIVLGLGFILTLREPPLTRKRPQVTLKGYLLSMTEGLRLVRASPALTHLAISGALANFGYYMAMTISPFFAYRVLGYSPFTMGVIIALGALGALVGSLMAIRIKVYLGLGRVLFVGQILTALGLVGVLLATPHWGVIYWVTGLFISSFGSAIYQANQMTLRQTIAKNNVLGRINATMRTLILCCIPVGQFLGALIAQNYGVRTAILLGVIFATLTPLWILFSPLGKLMTGDEENFDSVRLRLIDIHA